MRVKLRVLEGSEKSLEIPLKGPKFFVGRDKSCHLRPRSDLISRHHCVILIESGYLGVRDFGSKNGTLINGERVVDRQKLQAGDHLTIGPLKFEVVVEQTVGSARPTRANDGLPPERQIDDSTHSDDDIDGWLNEPEEEADKSVSDTHVMRAQDSAFTDTTINKKSSGDAEDQRIDQPQSRKSGRTDPDAANSQHAAARVLRQLNQQMRDKRESEDKKD